MPTAGPYGITQFDAPGIIGAYQDAQQNSIRMMMEQKQLEREDADAKRTSNIAAAWSKVVGPSSGSKAVDAYGSKPDAAPAASAPPPDPLAPLPDAAPAPASAAPSAASPDQINREAVPQLLSALGPEQGMAFLEHWQTLDKSKQEAVVAHNKEIGQAIAWADTPQKWDQAVDVLSKQNPQLAQYKGHFDQRGQAALQIGAISSFVEASKPDLMTVGAGQSVIDKAHPELGPSYTAPADYHEFTVQNADGTTTPYGFDPKTGKTFQLQNSGGPAADTTGGQPGGFDHAVAHVLSNEGGYNPSDMNGAPVNFGINQKANPGVDVKNMTVDQAKQIYHDKYWVPSGAESLPANLQAPYFDVYIRNPAFAKKALTESGGDPAKFMAESSNYFQTLAKKPSGQRYAQAWANRDAKNTAIATGGGSPITGKPMTNDPDTTDTAKFIGGQVALGQPMPPLGMGKQAAQMRQAILAEATKQWKAMGISPGEANVIAAENKSGLVELGKISQMKAQVQTAENTASANASQVLSLLGSAGTTGSPIFNAWQQAGRRATGDPKVSAFDVAVKTLSTEYARVMSGGNSQQLSDTARHEADALIHTSMAPDQFRSTIKQMKIDMANRTKGIEEERQATLTQIRSGGRSKPPAEESWITLPSGLKIRKVQ